MARISQTQVKATLSASRGASPSPAADGSSTSPSSAVLPPLPIRGGKAGRNTIRQESNIARLQEALSRARAEKSELERKAQAGRGKESLTSIERSRFGILQGAERALIDQIKTARNAKGRGISVGEERSLENRADARTRNEDARRKRIAEERAGNNPNTEPITVIEDTTGKEFSGTVNTSTGQVLAVRSVQQGEPLIAERFLINSGANASFLKQPSPEDLARDPDGSFSFTPSAGFSTPEGEGAVVFGAQKKQEKLFSTVPDNELPRTFKTNDFTASIIPSAPGNLGSDTIVITGGKELLGFPNPFSGRSTEFKNRGIGFLTPLIEDVTGENPIKTIGSKFQLLGTSISESSRENDPVFIPGGLTFQKGGGIVQRPGTSVSTESTGRAVSGFGTNFVERPVSSLTRIQGEVVLGAALGGVTGFLLEKAGAKTAAKFGVKAGARTVGVTQAALGTGAVAVGGAVVAIAPTEQKLTVTTDLIAGGVGFGIGFGATRPRVSIRPKGNIRFTNSPEITIGEKDFFVRGETERLFIVEELGQSGTRKASGNFELTGSRASSSEILSISGETSSNILTLSGKQLSVTEPISGGFSDGVLALRSGNIARISSGGTGTDLGKGRTSQSILVQEVSIDRVPSLREIGAGSSVSTVKGVPRAPFIGETVPSGLDAREFTVVQRFSSRGFLQSPVSEVPGGINQAKSFEKGISILQETGNLPKARDPLLPRFRQLSGSPRGGLARRGQSSSFSSLFESGTGSRGIPDSTFNPSRGLSRSSSLFSGGVPSASIPSSIAVSNPLFIGLSGSAGRGGVASVPRANTLGQLTGDTLTSGNTLSGASNNIGILSRADVLPDLTGVTDTQPSSISETFSRSIVTPGSSSTTTTVTTTGIDVPVDIPLSPPVGGGLFGLPAFGFASGGFGQFSIGGIGSRTSRTLLEIEFGDTSDEPLKGRFSGFELRRTKRKKSTKGKKRKTRKK